MKNLIILFILFSTLIAYFVSNYNKENNIFIERSSSKSITPLTSPPNSNCDYKNYNINYFDPNNIDTVAGRLESYYEKNERLINNENTKLVENTYPQIANAKIIGFRINNIKQDSNETQYLNYIFSLNVQDFAQLEYKQFLLNIVCNQAKIVRNHIFNNGGVDVKNKNILLNEILSDYNKIETIDENDNSFDDFSRLEGLNKVNFPDLFKQIKSIVTIDN